MRSAGGMKARERDGESQNPIGRCRLRVVAHRTIAYYDAFWWNALADHVFPCLNIEGRTRWSPWLATRAISANW